MQPVDTTKLTLSAIYFMPHVSVVSGGLRESSITSWSSYKYPTIKAVELKNGDVQLFHPDGRVSTLSPWMIAYRVHNPEAAAKPAVAK
jgi:hypothetical protein